jgi:hypothetical protein
MSEYGTETFRPSGRTFRMATLVAPAHYRQLDTALTQELTSEKRQATIQIYPLNWNCPTELF